MKNILNKNFLVYLAGNIVFGFTQWFVIVLIIKFGTKLELGAYTYGVAVIAPILLMMSYGYSTLIVTKPELQKSMIYLTRWLNMIITFTLYGLFIWLWSDITSDLYKLMAVIALTKIAESLMEIDYSYAIKLNKHWKVGVYKIILPLYQLCLIVVGYYKCSNLFLPLLIYSTTVIIFATYKSRRQFSFKTFNWQQLLMLIKFGMPLSIALFLSSLNTNIPKYALENYKSLADVGIFSSLIIFYSAGNVFYYSLYNFLLPRVVDRQHNRSFLQRLLLLILTGNGVILLGLIILEACFIESAIKLVFNAQFLNYKRELLIIITSSFAVYTSTLLDLFINTFQKYTFNTVTQIISVCVVFIGSIYLIPIYSVFGAALTFVLFAITVFSLKLLISIFIIRGVKHGD